THRVLSASKRVVRSAAMIAATAGPVALAVIMGARLAAQITPPAANAPTFEVASVKMNNTPGRRGGGGGPGRLNMVGMPVRTLIRQAYQIHESQGIGGTDCRPRRSEQRPG